MQRFNDDDYEGLTLKIPYWFYNLNREKLKPALDNLREVLEHSMSFMHQDNQSNVYELEHIEDKKQVQDEKIKKEAELKKYRIKTEQDKIDGNLYEIGENKYTDAIDIDRGFTFVLKDKTEIRFNEDDMTTKSHNLNATFLKKFDEIRNDIDWEATSFENQLALLLYKYTDNNGFTTKPEDITIGNFSSDIWTLRLTFSVRAINFYFRKRNGNLFYRQCNLEWSKERNCYSFVYGTGRIFLDNYHEKQGRFYKNT
jgi:uncharacterized protein YdhG (YjbR/CyaY superfamily)